MKDLVPWPFPHSLVSYQLESQVTKISMQQLVDGSYVLIKIGSGFTIRFYAFFSEWISMAAIQSFHHIGCGLYWQIYTQ